MMICKITMMMILLLVLVLDNAALHPSSVDTVIHCRPEEHDAFLSFNKAFPISNTSGELEGDICANHSARTEGWEKNGNCFKWDGVMCDLHSNHVVELELDSSCLSESFSSNTSLVLLPRLRYLSLSLNSLSGQVPREIGWLSHLTTLDISDNYDLKMFDFGTFITNLTALRELHLSEVHIDSYLPPILFNFSNLASLNLNECSPEGEFLDVDVNTSMLARVTYINLAYNMLTGIIPGWLFTRPPLDSLILYDNMFMEISELKIGNTSSLTSFCADTNRLQGMIPYDIFEIHNLRVLELPGNNLSGTIPLSKLHKLQNLNSLSLSYNSLSIIDDDMDIVDSKPSWPSFEYLGLSSCNLGHFPNFLREQVIGVTMN